LYVPQRGFFNSFLPFLPLSVHDASNFYFSKFTLNFMRRDTIFYQLFLRFPQLLFELVPNKPADAEQYIFESIEVKETSFRSDGAWMPPTPEGTVYFAEVQFQPDEILYERMNAEIGVFTFRNRHRCSSWRGVVLFPTRDLQQSSLTMVSHLLDSGKIIPIFLDELPSDASPALKLMVLTTLEGEDAITAAKQALARNIDNRDIIEMVTTIMVYKFTQLTRAEVDAMLGVTLQETRVYQEAKAEGKAEGKSAMLAMISTLLSQRFGALPQSMIDRLAELSIEQLEALGTQLFNFTQLTDITAWLEQ
jgi:predicted transposase/invertase (TIGR01784 family)